MQTYAEIAAKLMTDAASFFRTLGEHNVPLKEQMDENARIFDDLSAVLAGDPAAMLDGTPVSEVAGKLLQDAAVFFRTLAQHNEPIRRQMGDNAAVYEQIGAMLMKNPGGTLS